MPLTIHAAWLPAETKVPDGQLFIWAETEQPDTANGSTDGEREPHTNGHTNGHDSVATRRAEGSGRRPAKVPSHPAQMPVGQLRQLLRELVTADEGLDGQLINATAWLPSQFGQPQPRRGSFQRGVTALSGAETAPVRLAPWQITGLAFEPFLALTFLTRLGNHQLLEGSGPTSLLRHARLGNDLLFWSHAAKYVLETLAGQHFIPGLTSGATGRVSARWQPSMRDSELRHRLEMLVDAMPPLCRAYNLATLEGAPSPGALVEHFIATLVDRAIRHWAAETPAQSTSSAGQWLYHLLAENSSLQLPPQPAHQLYQNWLAWIEQLHASNADINFRLTFVLESPDANVFTQTSTGQLSNAGEAVWILRYYLQARDNPELMVPAEQVWQEKNHSLRVNGRRFDQPQERLLAGLGAASRLFAPIKESLRSPRPEMARLSTEDAYHFLREIGPLLESSGFGVVFPSWWHAQTHTRLGMRLRLFSEDRPDRVENRRMTSEPSQRQGSALTLNSLIRFHWELTLGDQPLNPEEFERLVALQSPLINIRGRWVELDPEQAAAARTFLHKNRPEGQLNLLQAVRMAQAYLREEGEGIVTGTDLLPALDLDKAISEVLPLDTVEVEGWLEQVLMRLRDQEKVEEIEEPEGFVGKLRPYQRRGVGWLDYLRRVGLGACLADDMGLGKTIQAIALLLHQRNNAAAVGETVAPSLLICPTSVVANWRHEIERFAPQLKALVHHGSGRQTGEEFIEALNAHDLVITSYGTARRDIDTLESITWSDVILDEAQNIKNPSAKQTQAAGRINALNRMALTGTPVENRLLELWSIMEFLNPGYLGNRERFRQQYILPIERYNDETALSELRRLVQPFLLRRLKTDPTIINDLPEKNEMVVYCPLSKEQATLYNDVIQQTMDRVEQSEGIQRRGLVLSLLLRLKQVCNHPAHFLGEKEPLKGRSGKLSRLTEMLDEALSVGDRALVFTQFVEMGHLLQTHLQETFGCEVLFLHGGTPAAKRDQMVRSFQESENGPPIFVLSLRAGGVGLNLTRANHVFHFDRWWNPAVENQATDRAFRIGQKRSVHVYKFVVAGTLEERIHELIETKQSLAESIVGSGEDWLAEIDTDELRRILALRKEDVEEEVMG
jgi:SNF2 family DNA or RNA helicase